MEKLVLLFFIFLYSKTSSEVLSNSNGCPSEFVLIASKCYSFQQQTKSWLAAKSFCEGDGAELASVKTRGQYTNLLNHLNDNYPGRYWVSGALRNGDWVWADDSPMNNEWFGRVPQRTGNFCAYFCSITNKYWSGPCNLKKKFICEADVQLSVDAEVATSNRGPPQIEPRRVVNP